MAADTVRILHGARSLPPAQAAEALEPFLESMVLKKGAGNKLADASTDAVMALSRSLKENQGVRRSMAGGHRSNSELREPSRLTAHV
jgi:hypothetical protein